MSKHADVCFAEGCSESREPRTSFCTKHQQPEQKPLALPTDAKERKSIPLATGCLYYFPAALAEVAKLSKIGNDKHNPGEPLHHARGKSMDHADCIVRHQIDAGTIDPDTGLDHAVMVAWRALAQLQEILESRGAPLARGARAPTPAASPAPKPCPSCGGYAPRGCQDC